LGESDVEHYEKVLREVRAINEKLEELRKERIELEQRMKALKN
jgi:cell division protein FtsB